MLQGECCDGAEHDQFHEVKQHAGHQNHFLIAQQVRQLQQPDHLEEQTH